LKNVKISRHTLEICTGQYFQARPDNFFVSLDCYSTLQFTGQPGQAAFVKFKKADT